MSAPCLALDATGRKVAIPLRLVSGPEAVAVKVRCRLDSVVGSWLEDERIGFVDLDLLENPATPGVVYEGRVRRQVREVPGVLSVERVTASKTGDSLSIVVVLTVDEGDTGPTRIAVASDDDDGIAPGSWFAFLGSANPLIQSR